MTEPLRDTWHVRDLPVLREVARIVDTDPDMAGARLADIADATGLTVEEVMLSLRALEADSLIEVRWMYPAHVARVAQVSGRARRVVGMWPSPEGAFDRIIAALERISADQHNPERDHAREALDGLHAAGAALRLSVGAAALGQDAP